MVINKEGIIYYKEPPKDEFSNRCDTAKKQLELNDLDLLFIYSDDRMMHGPGNVRYFSDFPAHFEDVAIIISKESEPILVSGPECKEYANLVSTIKDVRVIEEFAMPDEDYPFTEMTGISSIVQEIEKAGGEKIKRFRRMTNKNVEIFEHIADPEKFIRNALKPAKVKEIRLVDRVGGSRIAMVSVETKDKGIAIGRNGQNIKKVRFLAKRYFDLETIVIN